jgi:hypothetical protein
MTTGAGPPVHVEILARKDCDNRGMAVVVVERVAAEMGIPVALDMIDVTTEAQARKQRFLGSPSVRVDGLDVEPGTNGFTDFTLGDRVYRSGSRGLQGWPDERWIRAALVVAQSAANGNGDGSPSARSSTTSP